ncbi:hypothetical protein QTP88_029273 [Uroleucon formosanum]
MSVFATCSLRCAWVAQNSSAYEKDDKVSIALFNPNIKTPLYTGLRSDDVLTNLKSIINGLLTSNEEIDITETTFQVQVVNIPRGSRGNKIINLSTDSKTKRSIIQIKNYDNLCCPRAIIAALATQTNNILGHKLDFNKIRNCEEKINEHKCYMQPIIQKGGKCNTIDCTKYNKGNTKYKCSYTEKYLFFDYEAQQETGTHIANKIIAHHFEGNKIMFDTNEEFCKHVISEEYSGYTLIAHYAKGYDSQFILKYLVDNTLKPFTIYSGTKLMLLEIKYLSIRIIDSSNFIQCPLSSFPKTFGLKELKKGYFPHFFNTVENQNYIGILPNKKYYGVETMKSENKIKFEKWYNEKINENYLFNFKEELVAYCTTDVDILRRECLELRK